MRVWKSDPRTGRYPLPHIVWHVLWVAPVIVTGALFLFVILCAYGPRCAVRVYHEVGC